MGGQDRSSLHFSKTSLKTYFLASSKLYFIFRKGKKKSDILRFKAGGLISAGQQEVHSTQSSKRSTLHSKFSTIKSKHENIAPTSLHKTHKENVKDKSETETSPGVNINVIILQSRSSEKLISDLKEKKLLQKSDSVSSSGDESDCDKPKINISLNFKQQKQTPLIESSITVECKECPDSPVVLRKFLNDHMRTIPLNRSKKTGKTKRSDLSNLTGKDEDEKASDFFYSIESNLDQNSFPKLTALSKPGDIPDTHISSLPSMTSGRFYSAASSVFSGISSPCSDLSPSKDSEERADEKHIEPNVDILVSVGKGKKCTSGDKGVISKSVPSISFERKRLSLPTKNNNNVQVQESDTLSSFKEESSMTRKSLPMSSHHSSLTKVSISNEDFPLEHNLKRVKDSKRSNALMHMSNTLRKFPTLSIESRPRQNLSSFGNQKLEMKYLGSTDQSIPACQTASEHFFEEGKLSGWSTKDIHDIVSKDIPRMDVVVLVVDQTEKKQIDLILSRTTGVVGYIREYWSGYFPLLLIEISDEKEETEMIHKKSILSITSLFSVTHRIIIEREEKKFVFESIGRFYNHIKVFHCEKFQKSLHTKKLGHLVSLSLTERFWFCSGLCQMRVTKKKENNDEVNSGKSRFMRTVRNTIYRNRLVGDTPIQSEEVT